MKLDARKWTAPDREQIADMVKWSGLTQAEVADRAGLSLDRLKRIVGRKSGRDGSAPRIASFGEWLALVVATAPDGDSRHHPGGKAAGAAAESVTAFAAPLLPGEEPS